MSPQPNVSFIGAGNVAWHLAPALDNAGFAVREIYNRSAAAAEALAERLYQAEVKDNLDFSNSAARIFFLTVADDAIVPLVRELVLPDDAVLTHVSGSQPLDVLEYAATEHIGVFYPLQTFSRGRAIDFADVPIFLEARTETAGQALTNLARALSKNVVRIGSQQRLALHVSAVVAANFTNYLLGLAQQLMEQNDLPPEWLRPLVAETIAKNFELGAAAAQTGPARRGDLETLDRHHLFLSDQPAFAEVYRHISQQILDYYQPN
jgi:predicted short-subunit dehydrogenase-like oxidoreductase (DUF2520 family)